MEIFVTRPEHDDVTFCLSQCFKPIIEECKERGIKLFDLLREKANKKQVHEILSKTSAKLAVFNGHGNDEYITGHKNQILIQNDNSVSLLKNRIVYAIACNSATKLGPNCIKQGTIAYIGYNLPFVIMSNPNKGLNPQDDELVKPVMDSSNEIILTLIKGNSVDEAYARSQIKFDYYIKKYQRADAPIESQNMLPVLYWNKMAQTKLGDSKAKLI